MHPRFQTAFAQLADNLQSALEPILADKYFPALLTGEQVSSLKSATGLDEDALAFALLPLAAACARTPLSNFNVGAIARGVSGTWYFGANMEFIGATMQQTVHAEQSAISHAWLSGEKALAAITVNYTPCGHCRQFMNELNSGLDRSCNSGLRSRPSIGKFGNVRENGLEVKRMNSKKPTLTIPIIASTRATISSGIR